MADGPSRQALLRIALLVALAGCLPLASDALAQKKPRLLVEDSYVERSKAIAEGDHDARIELASWCREMGFMREMLTEIDRILEKEPDHGAARTLLLQVPADGKWALALPETALRAAPPDLFEKSHSMRRKALDASPQTEFKLAKKAFRFDYWTDIDRERCSEYVKLMNSYYDRLKGFFQITKTELGIDVLLFSRRADFLSFYSSHTGKSGEHSLGFFSHGPNLCLLCFYDDAYDDSVFDTAKHECTHLLMKQCLRGASPAIWLDEGMACYFAGDGPERSGSYAAESLLIVLGDLEREEAIPLADLIEIPQEQFKRREYATAWSWIAYLHANPGTKKKLGQLLRRLRQAAEDRDESEEGQLTNETNRHFKKIFGPPERLQEGWRAWVSQSLLPEGDSQKFEYAHKCLEKAYFGKKLSQADRTHALREGEKWLRLASTTADKRIAARCALENAYRLLARARSMVYRERETGYAAAEAARIVNEILCATDNRPKTATLDYHAGLIAQRGLFAIWNAGDYEDDETPTCDFDALLRSREADLAKKIDSKRTRKAEKVFLLEDMDTLRLHRVCAERLALAACCAYSRALAKDPGHRLAARQWLILALEFVPSELDAVFPHILAQVEIDPNDRNMAALAAAYAAMGKPAFGRTLIDRAIHLAADEDDLAFWVRVVSRAENQDG